MYLRDLWASCRRRWGLLLALVILSEGILLGVSSTVEPTYEAEASMVLIPPPSSEIPDLNRLLDLGSLGDSVEVLARSMRSADVQEDLEAVAPDAEFEVSPDYSSSAPILLLDASGPDQDETAELLAALLERAPRNLEQLQAGLDIPERSRITQVVVSRDPEPVPDLRSRLRVLGVLAVALVALSAVLVAALDGILLRRSAGRPAKEPRTRPRRPAAPLAPTAPREPEPEERATPDPRTGTGWPELPAEREPVGHGRPG